MEAETIDLANGNTKLDDLLSLLREGTEVILTDGEKPLARLIPFERRTGERIAGLHSGLIHASEDFDEPLPNEFWVGEG
jgi:antitoxin (DNA-binding transcriptional repressor) of toxin-antitoxin stability system